MSLLMDALKKAEEEKKKAIEQTQEGRSQATDTTVRNETAGRAEPDAGPALEPREPPSREARQTPEPIVDEPDFGSLADDEAPGLSLEPMPGAGEEERAAELTGSTHESTVPGRRGDTLGADTTTGSARRGTPYDQESTLPSERAIQTSLQEYFESSQSMERQQVAPAPATAQDVVDVDETVGTRVSAETVFAARSAPATARTINLVILACVLLAVVLAASGAYYYYSRPPTPVRSPSPLVARGVEKPIVTEFTLPELSAPEERLAGSAGAEAQEVEPAPRAPETAPAPEVSATPVAPERAAPTPAARPPPPTRTALAESMTDTVSAQVRGPRQEVLAKVDADAIKITKSRKPRPANTMARDAYAAFTAGDLRQAKQLYEAALAKEPNNRDALLGRAAVAVQEGDLDTAYASYLRVLKLNPKDGVASAALFNMRGFESIGVTESRLKMLIDEVPDSAPLYFALGNNYARSGRWGDAQQAYFDAFRFDGDNPDYAFNLAVSLDRLGKFDAARSYYQRAVEIAAQGQANFDTTTAEKRIAALSAAAAE